jgi:hypothetical protein
VCKFAEIDLYVQEINIKASEIRKKPSKCPYLIGVPLSFGLLPTLQMHLHSLLTEIIEFRVTSWTTFQ